MNRYRAAAIHLGISAVIACIVFLVVYLVWYPDALFGRAGGRSLFLLLAGVNVILGPLITLIIFVTGKKGLTFDLVTIGVVQVAALLYGTWVLFEWRPAYFVFVKDRFELARAIDIDAAELAAAKPPYDRLPSMGPRVVGARLPRDPQEQFRIMMSAMSGTDLQGFPQYYVAYDEVRTEAIAHAKPLTELRKYNDAADVETLMQAFGARAEGLRYLPMRAGKIDFTVVIDGKTADVLRVSALLPWEFK